ncbi:autophagy-related protein 13 [Scheffersomyces coipomensis]|uniref:autophagy-related protein 13 n=1 Tax=Scheffersomyces coipomensis TaxID=1788519 RepID=UPI00315D078B
MSSNQYQFKSQQEHYPQELDKTHTESYKNLNSKLSQVIVNFFTKTAVIIYEARSIPEATPIDMISNLEDKSKINRWFNLNTNSTKDSLRDELKLWKSMSDVSSLPPMIIETYLDLRQLGSNEAFVLKDDFGKAWSVAKGGGKRKEVVLERWCIEFEYNANSSAIIDELPLIYKRAIILLRSLYGFSRIISSYKLKKLIDSNNKLKKLRLKNKTFDGSLPISSKGRVGLSKSIIPHQLIITESHLSQKYFQPVQTSLGTFKISVAYRNHYEFDIVDKEEALSSEFMNMDNKHSTGPRARFDIDHVEEIDASITSKHSPHHHLDDDDDDHVEHEQQQEVEDEDEDETHDQHQHQSMEYSSDISKHQATSIPASNKRLSISSVSMSISPCSSANKDILRENSPGTGVKKPSKVSAIQPFKVGSISDSPPPIGSGGSSLERKVSITSNKSTSNASLAATLRNPRSSTSLSHTATILINNNPTSSTNTPTGGGIVTMGSIPRSISSSHGSNLHPDEAVFSNDSNANTPRFSSSFGSRASRRFSNTSIKQSTPLTTSTTQTSHEILGTSIGSTTSSGAPFSGLYLDDDINDFVRMIDSTSDLRFSSAYNNSGGIGGGGDLRYNQSSATSESLNRFHSLKSQHQQLGESVHASLVSQSGTGSGIGITGSRASSRKSSHSMNSPPASIPSINSRLKERSPGIGGGSGSISGAGQLLSLSSSSPPPVGSQIPITGVPPSGAIVNEIRRSLSPDKRPENNSNSPFLKSASTNQITPNTVVSRTTAHGNSVVHKHDEDVGGLATTPSVYKKSIRYENVFDDDDEDDDELDSKVGTATTIQTEQNTLKSKPTTSTDDNNQQADVTQDDEAEDRANTTIEKQHEADDHHLHHHLHHHHHHHHNAANSEDFEDDDLLFTMSDMNLTKN